MDLPPAQVQCVSNVIQNEARGETFVGQQAVGHVILNRSRIQGKLPCIIVKQPGQFKYTPGIKHKTYKITIDDPTNGSIYFKTFTARSWKYEYTVTIGRHKFYK